MQPNFTQKNLGYFCTRIIALALIFSASTQFSFAQQSPARENASSLIEKQKATQNAKPVQPAKSDLFKAGNINKVGRVRNIDLLKTGTVNKDAGIHPMDSHELESPQACTWTASTVYPIPVLDQACVSVGTTLYSFAGVSNNAVIATSWKFDGTTWTSIAPTPQGLEYPAAVTDGTNIYLLGGASTAGTPLTTLYRYNVAANTYTTLASFSTGVWNTAAVYMAGKIYKFGGTGPATASTNVMEIYDVAGNTWSAGAVYPLAASFVSAFGQGGFVYGCGGFPTATVETAKTYRYDPVANTWNDAAIADLPATRWGAASGLYNGGFLMAGGYVGGSLTANILPSVVQWDPVGNSWSPLPDMTLGTGRVGGAPMGGSMYVIGGRTQASAGFVGSTQNQKLFCDVLTPCSGTPNAGNTVSSINPVCPSVPFTLSLSNTLSGLTYQWQISTTGVGGPFSNIGGATGSTYTTSITTATAYRCIVTCTASGLSGNSVPLLENISPLSACYCGGGATDVIDEKISRVRYATIDNSSSSTAGYEDFTAISTTVIQGSTQPITVDISNFFTGDLVRVWIDFNQNGNFTDPGERVVATTVSANPGVGTITIPVTSSIGPTRMRVRMYWQPSDPDPGPCGNTVYGQVEDYTVNIQPCIQGVFNTHPANQTIQCGGTANFSVTTSGSLLTYGWEYKTSAASPFWLNVTNGGVYSGATTSTLTITNAPQTMNGYVYRATIIGPCTAIDFSNSATLTVGPYIVNVSPSSATICTGTIQQLTITNTISAPVTTVFSSGAINIPIPDANVAGINHTIPVSGISGIITDVSVRFSIPAHTYAGDLCVVVRGPGGQILNLDYFITATGSPGAGLNNTNLSSNAPLTAKLNTGAAPWTGTFTPDAQTVPSPALGNPPIGPTGFQTPAVGSYSGLVNFANGSTANGNWTIAVYDGFGLDVGNLTNWQVSITYVAPVFATGVWTASPAAPNTMWINALATIPYVPGSQQTTIWVNPIVNTNYTVVVTTATPCVSAPTVVPVSVTNPITALVAPINRTVCVGTNASFSVSAGGGPLIYQWQVSVDGGITYNNIVGATAATLNLIGVTQLMNNNLYRVTVTAAPCGSATTAAARLNVNQLPIVTISSTFLQLVPGRVATLTGSSSPAPLSATSWSWTLNGSTIAGATTNTVTANIDQQGAYRATVTDINGCVGSSNTLTIGSEVSDRLWIIPNPNTGQFQVRLFYNSAMGERRIIKIYSSGGQLMAQKEVDLASATPPYVSISFNLPTVGAGTYVVKVVDRNSQVITSGLMVIQ